jgi:hypothetical protein
MEKEKVLVLDNHGVFLRMFKKHLNAGFIVENSVLNKNDPKDYSYQILVAYNKEELIKFFKLDKNRANIIVCLFNKEVPGSLFFLKEIKNVILCDSTKTRSEIFKQLKLYFKNTSDPTLRMPKANFLNSCILQTKFHDSYKALFFLV